jgi:glutamate-1-semialdehyde aminotransferase
LKADKKTADLFHSGLRANGIMASTHPLFISSAHTEQQVGTILDVSERVLKEMKG